MYDAKKIKDLEDEIKAIEDWLKDEYKDADKYAKAAKWNEPLYYSLSKAESNHHDRLAKRLEVVKKQLKKLKQQ